MKNGSRAALLITAALGIGTPLPGLASDQACLRTARLVSQLNILHSKCPRHRLTARGLSLLETARLKIQDAAGRACAEHATVRVAHDLIVINETLGKDKKPDDDLLALCHYFHADINNASMKIGGPFLSETVAP